MATKRRLIYLVFGMILTLPTVLMIAQETKPPDNTSATDKIMPLADIEKGVAELTNSRHEILAEILDNSLFSPEKIRDREALAWIIGEYMRRTQAMKNWQCTDEEYARRIDEGKEWLCAPRADEIFFVYGAHVIDLINGEAKPIWNWSDKELSFGWMNFLKSQGISEPQIKKRISAENIFILIYEKGGPMFYVGTALVGNTPVIGLSFDREYYCQPIADDRRLDFIPNECFLDRWRGAEEKTARSEAELVSRMVSLPGEFYKLNYLRRGDNLARIDKCERLLNRNTPAIEIENCAELLWDYRLVETRVVYEASQKFGSVCLDLKNPKTCKKPGNLFTPAPTQLLQFLSYERNKERGMKNYTRQMLKNGHPGDKSPDYDPQKPDESTLYDLYRGYWDGKK